MFSRLYKYLSFVSTTNEKFQSHINIDSGYKYLTTDSILKSDNSISNAYFDDDGKHRGDEKVPYASYLTLLLDQYLPKGG